MEAELSQKDKDIIEVYARMMAEGKQEGIFWTEQFRGVRERLKKEYPDIWNAAAMRANMLNPAARV